MGFCQVLLTPVVGFCCRFNLQRPEQERELELELEHSIILSNADKHRDFMALPTCVCIILRLKVLAVLSPTGGQLKLCTLVCDWPRPLHLASSLEEPQ